MKGHVEEANGSDTLPAMAAGNTNPTAEGGGGGPVGIQNAAWIGDMSFEG